MIVDILDLTNANRRRKILNRTMPGKNSFPIGGERDSSQKDANYANSSLEGCEGRKGQNIAMM
jgi:hypothetical protein